MPLGTLGSHFHGGRSVRVVRQNRGAMVMLATRFANRREAGRQLGQALLQYRGRPDVLVLGLPRGGVPVACEVADVLGAPLDVFVVRKLGMPGHEEFAIGAIASGGVRYLDNEILRAYNVSQATVARIAQREEAELARRERLYRGDHPPPALNARTLILVDDGLATGATMRAAVIAVRSAGPAAVVVAVPVAPAESCELLRRDADEVVCLLTPTPFEAVGLWYDDFSETSDDEVRSTLATCGRG
jgi:putative phosphoribosyl transferase